MKNPFNIFVCSISFALLFSHASSAQNHDSLRKIHFFVSNDWEYAGYDFSFSPSAGYISKSGMVSLYAGPTWLLGSKEIILKRKFGLHYGFNYFCKTKRKRIFTPYIYLGGSFNNYFYRDYHYIHLTDYNGPTIHVKDSIQKHLINFSEGVGFNFNCSKKFFIRALLSIQYTIEYEPRDKNDPYAEKNESNQFWNPLLNISTGIKF